MARATAWGKPTVGDRSHHVTQNAAPAPDAIMRRSSRTDRGQKQGASYLPGLQNNPQKKIKSSHLRPLITEANPRKDALRAPTKHPTTARRLWRRKNANSDETGCGLVSGLAWTALHANAHGHDEVCAPIAHFSNAASSRPRRQTNAYGCRSDRLVITNERCLATRGRPKALRPDFSRRRRSS